MEWQKEELTAFSCLQVVYHTDPEVGNMNNSAQITAFGGATYKGQQVSIIEIDMYRDEG